jgi:hypothetical protein
MYFVGLVDPALISAYKRTRQFSLEDFELLLRICRWFQQIVTTPNILTEVNNLAGQLSHEQTRRWRSKFRSSIASFVEEYISTNSACDSPQFELCGLTDSTILEVAHGKRLVLTDDLDLYVRLQSAGVDALNFNHLRTLNWRL